jgi:hypothetical protein
MGAKLEGTASTSPKKMVVRIFGGQVKKTKREGCTGKGSPLRPV